MQLLILFFKWYYIPSVIVFNRLCFVLNTSNGNYFLGPDEKGKLFGLENGRETSQVMFTFLLLFILLCIYSSETWVCGPLKSDVGVIYNFEVVSNIQDQKLKIQKHIAVDVLFKAYPIYHPQADPIWSDGTFKRKNQERKD